MVLCTSSSELSLGPVTTDLMVFLRDVVVSSSASPFEFCFEAFLAASPVMVFLLPRPVDLKTSGLRTGRLEHRMATLSSVNVQRAAETLFHVGSVAIDAARRVGRRIIETMHTLLSVLDMTAQFDVTATKCSFHLQKPKTKNREEDYPLSWGYGQLPYTGHWKQENGKVGNQTHSRREFPYRQSVETPRCRTRLDCCQRNAGYGEEDALDGCPKPDKHEPPEADNTEAVAREDTAVLQKKGDLDDVHAKVVAEDRTEETLRLTISQRRCNYRGSLIGILGPLLRET